jgi:general stress protein 26
LEIVRYRIIFVRCRTKYFYMHKEFIKKGIELIKTADAAYLTTIDQNGFPSTRAMLNLKNNTHFPKLEDFMVRYEDDLTLFFTTSTSSTKVSQIRDTPKVSVYYCDPKSWHGFMCQGEIEIVSDTSIKHAIWLNEWVMYYPDGKDSEDYTILRLRPKYLKSYFQFHQADLKI